MLAGRLTQPPHFTCFTSTNVQILTQECYAGRPLDSTTSFTRTIHLLLYLPSQVECLELLVYEALSYECMRLLVYEALSY
jgi:hypothetical protein